MAQGLREHVEMNVLHLHDAVCSTASCSSYNVEEKRKKREIKKNLIYIISTAIDKGQITSAES